MFKKRNTKVDYSPPKRKVKYPKYSYVYNIDNDTYYLLLDKTKKEFISSRAFKSWGAFAPHTTSEAISGYSLYGKKGFRPGTIIRSIFDGKTYFVGEELIHPITSREFYDILGYTSESITFVSESEIQFYKIGDAINGI